ncbi:MAG: LacI family DNA-binding transcriptional regulator [Mycobacteriales bacterium]
MARITIADLARELGISKSAVSYALNSQPGVSAATRERVQELARRHGWYPSSSARALSGAGPPAIGLVLSRPIDLLATEQYFMRFVSGVESVLVRADSSLLLRVVGDRLDHEIETYRRWWGERRVAGVIVMDERFRDPRVQTVARLGMPAVVLGGPLINGASGGCAAPDADERPHPAPDLGRVTTMWTDHAADVRVAVDHLLTLGHRRLLYIGGPKVFQHERRRRRAISALGGSDRVEWARCLDTDYTLEGADAVTREALGVSARARPTAVIFGSDLMATAGLRVAAELGVRIPGDLSVVAWDESPLCTIVSPTLTSLDRDVPGYGARAATALLSLVGGAAPAVLREPDCAIKVRQSSGPAPTG